jgi:hypothetical protein
MSAGMAMFQSELRSAVQDARRDPPAIPPRPVLTRNPKGVAIRLWLPLTPLWVVLSPFALLLAPLITFAPRLMPMNRRAGAVRDALTAHPYRAAFALGGVLLAMSGTVVDVDAPGARVHIRIF